MDQKNTFLLFGKVRILNEISPIQPDKAMDRNAALLSGFLFIYSQLKCVIYITIDF